MRMYHTLDEARSEIMRDLKEMGLPVRTKSYQNREVTDDSLATMEISPYMYTITGIQSIVPKPADVKWAAEEWKDRIVSTRQLINPGDTWKLRGDYWNQFFNENGQFDYTYGERIADQVNRCIDLLNRDPLSRRAVVVIWDREQEDCSNMTRRIPCSMYYHFMIRNGLLRVTYHQRSCDIMEHWQNDVYFARKMGEEVAYDVGVGLDRVIHVIGSLHAYNKDLEGVF